MFSVKVAKPVPLNAPSVDAILIGLDMEVEFDPPGERLPEAALPEELLPGEPLVGADFVLPEESPD